MAEAKWCFINENNQAEQIAIYDEESCQALTRILLLVKGERWTLKEEEQVIEKAAVPVPVAPPVLKVPAAAEEKRKQKRFSTEFKVILIAGAQSFRTTSQDVSIGGMKLNNKVPQSFLKQKCVAYICHEGLRENLEIVCNIVGDPTDPCRVQFVEPDPAQQKRLEEWIQKQNAAKKSA